MFWNKIKNGPMVLLLVVFTVIGGGFQPEARGEAAVRKEQAKAQPAPKKESREDVDEKEITVARSRIVAELVTILEVRTASLNRMKILFEAKAVSLDELKRASQLVENAKRQREQFEKADKTPPKASKEQWGSTTQGLQMSISATGKDKLGNPEFQVAVRNVGEQDVALNLGIMLANGKSQFPVNIRLNLTDDQGKNQELHFPEPRVTGRVDDYVVPLRAGSVYTLKLPLSDFSFELKPGKYRVSAQFEGGGTKHDSGKSVMNFWEGKLQSNTLKLEQ